MTIAIFGNLLKPETEAEVEHLIELLELRSADVVLSPELRQVPRFRSYRQFPESDEMIEFAISVGGDGTFLTTASAIGNRDIPILGINCGHLGFLADVKSQEEDAFIDQLLKGQYTIEKRAMLQVSCSEGATIVSPFALNEVAVIKYGLSSMISIDTQVNKEFLHRYQGDGLVIATPTGSTAYNMSLGGPLMVPQARGILLSPIASHSLNIRPLVIPDDWQIDMKVRSRTGSYLVSVDGRSQILSHDVTLHVQRAPYTTKLVQIGGNSFIQSLKNKLNWGI
ncbi:MAG: NAD kinase [Paludibacteraceae bacterium]|nr:NAD kinase [Paludibacteraceae bacterium]